MRFHYLITGGAGFIGSNYVSRLLDRGEKVTIFDNFSRYGAESNVNWLKEEYGKNSFNIIRGDVRDSEAVRTALADADVIVHLAGQVAVTTSVNDPRTDFEINALGTFNVLEGARLSGRDPIVLYASTNKVYGEMLDVEVTEFEDCYAYASLPFGASEEQPLDFHSPYGCSKGSGDQYVRDYHRIYGLRTVVLRQSCIYGTRQFGVEDQGWLAWFVIAAVCGRPITIYGNGKQVRDVLFVGDLAEAYDLAISNIDKAAGEVYNLGGGPANTLSVWAQFAPLLEKNLSQKINITRGEWRPGDQKIFVADIRKAKEDLGWEPKVSPEKGIEYLISWVKNNKDLFKQE